MSKKYQIEIEERLNAVLKEIAVQKNMPIELLIKEILSRFTVEPHILNSEDVKKGYEECGDINLELSNL